ncbi:MAG: DUF4867 family protein [Lachnospiraceae bacterium]|nr:DUF4867 family protein [Lachnospiraceae bacterium]
MVIYKVTDPEFRKYGRVLKGLDVVELVEKMQETPLPEDVIYEPSVESLEKLSIYKTFQDVVYGELPIQIGFCNGHNNKLNAVEYHRSSEINVGATDMILLLGCQQDIKEDFTYETSQIEAFLVPKGCAVEIYATTLHYAPCGIDGAGFRGVVVLPKDTNLPLDTKHSNGEDQLITAKNKWLIAHKDGGCGEGAFVGLVGENITL